MTKKTKKRRETVQLDLKKKNGGAKTEVRNKMGW